MKVKKIVKMRMSVTTWNLRSPWNLIQTLRIPMEQNAVHLYRLKRQKKRRIIRLNLQQKKLEWQKKMMLRLRNRLKIRREGVIREWNHLKWKILTREMTVWSRIVDLLRNHQRYTKRKEMQKILFRLKVQPIIRPKMPVNLNIEKTLKSKKELSWILLQRRRLGQNLGQLKKVSIKVWAFVQCLIKINILLKNKHFWQHRDMTKVSMLKIIYRLPRKG